MIMSYKKRKLNNRGFSLVEVLVAIVILAIISLPVLSTFSNAARINARARRTENANTAINNIIEEAKTMSLENLVNRQGQYYYAPTTDNNTYVVSDERGVSYYTGVNGEKYYIKATFDPGPYTDSDSTTDNKKNNINSAGLSVYADISSGNNFVFRDDNGDSQALSWFKSYKTDAARDKITKKTDAVVKLTYLGKNNGKLRFRQTIDVKVTYRYDTGTIYPDYVKTTTMSDYTFDALVKKEKRTVIEDGEEVTKEVDVNYISSKIEDNLESFYMFYTPFEGESTTEHYNQESITSKLVSDKINITYDVPSEITGEIVEYSDLNVYVLEQEKVVKTSSVFESMHVDKDKVTVSKCINGAVASSPLTDKIQVYSNIKNWALKNDVNNKNVLYRMTVRVWQWKDEYNHTDKQPSADSAIATVTTTKEN